MGRRIECLLVERSWPLQGRAGLVFVNNLGQRRTSARVRREERGSSSQDAEARALSIARLGAQANRRNFFKDLRNEGRIGRFD
jgi:hypothetical protein